MTKIDADSMKYKRKNGSFGLKLVALLVVGACVILFAVLHDSSHSTRLTSNSLLVQEFNAAHDVTGDNMPAAEQEITIAPEKLEMDDVQMYIQKPQGKTQGIVFLFHGCNHDGIDWFILPEGKEIVKYLLRQNQAVVAFSSHHRSGTKCWAEEFPAHHNHDARKIIDMYRKLLDKKFGKKSHKLPLYGIGASSGGNFLTVLNEDIKFDGIALIVADGNLSAIEWMNQHPSILPRVAFVYMPKDEKFVSASRIRRRERQLETHAVATFPCEPRPIYAKDLVARVDGLSFEDATSLVDSFSKAPVSIIDPKTHMLVEDPRAIWDSAWQSLEDAKLVQLPRLQVLALQEIFNVAYGLHETTSEHIDKVFAFWKEKTIDPQGPSKTLEDDKEGA